MHWGIIGALKQEIEHMVDQMDTIEKTEHDPLKRF